MEEAAQHRAARKQGWAGQDMPLVPTSSNRTLSPNSPFGYGLVSWVIHW